VFGIRVTATDLGVPMIASFFRNVESQKKAKLNVLSFKDKGQLKRLRDLHRGGSYCES
jgi:hypothetical protein